jgi:hypothetical protein
VTDLPAKYPPAPHARAAGTPTGRSFFWAICLEKSIN